ncbi:MAG: CvpA family protein [Oscillospiraceae bacterium]|nr:CvpA family protein [Oscillospiraceae bacterium]
MKAIIDLALLAILVLCTWTGYRKGFLMGIGGILCILVAVYGANLLSNVFSYDVVPALKPFISGYTESLLTDSDSEVLSQMGWSDSDYSLNDLLTQYPEEETRFCQTCYEVLGIDSTTAAILSERTVSYAEESGADMTDAIVHILCETISYVGCFILVFLLILILLTVIGNLPNLSFRIPRLDLFNDIAGAVMGLARGFLLCILLVWALKFMGMLLGGDALSASTLGGWLLRQNFLLNYLGV